MASGPEVDATVKWFNTEKGFGFVELGDGSGDAFMHIRAVEQAGHSDIPPGSKLTVRVAQGQKGPQVTEVLTVDTSTAEAPAPRREGGFGGGGYGDRGGFGDRGGGFGGPRRSGPRPGGFGARPTGPSVEVMGTVKWYNPTKGFGFVAADDGEKDVFVHRSALMRAGLGDLMEGQRVRLEVVDGQKGREAASVSLG